MSDIKYKNLILDFSLLLNAAQKPIQILDAIKWNEGTEDFIVKNNFKEMPKIDYRDFPLKYDPHKKLQEFSELRLKIARGLGNNDPLGNILIRNCLQYEDVVHMLMNRGNKEFYQYSKKLYGSPTELMNDGKTKLSDLASIMNTLLNSLDETQLGEVCENDLTAEYVVEQLSMRLEKFFTGENIKVKLSDGIISDASAGSDYIKIKKGMMFSRRDLDIFEVHEGWVHLGTTLNGLNQPFAKWLSKGPPCSTVTQEGLAVTMELFNFALFPRRAKRLNNRLIACQMVEDGANLLELISFFREKGQSDQNAIRNAGRIFRGTTLEGGAPFTKDIAYLKGFVMIYNFMRTTIKEGRADLIPFLFTGKVTLDDLPVLFDYHKEGVISLPKYLPPQIRDLNGLAIWMAFSNFLNRMKLEDIMQVKSNEKLDLKKLESKKIA
ncbi:MAG: flavohemoglobin expression-modulating QEGLA motif protein [Bacteriovorax sp.]|nr:flavohemoglobin expression-modulating QEGLA motif protein [Bacteriovorax sp.]